MAPSANFTHFLGARDREAKCLLYLEGIPEVLAAGGSPPDLESPECITLDGTGDYLENAVGANVFDLGDFTFCGWLYPDDVSNRAIFSNHDGTDGWAVHTRSTDGFITIRCGSGSPSTYVSTIELVASQWQFLAISAGGVNGIEVRAIHILLDADGNIEAETVDNGDGGSFVPSTGATGVIRAAWTVTEDLYLGHETALGTVDPWDGKMGPAAIWARALTVSEMRSIAFRRLSERWSIFSEGCYACWNMREGAGTVGDLVGDYPLTLVGNAAWSATNPFTVAAKEMTVPSPITQELDILSTRSSVGTFTVQVSDADDWLTSRLQAMGLAFRKRSAHLFLGFADMQEDEYELIAHGSIDSIQPLIGTGYEITIGDARSRAKVPLVLGKTTLAAALTDVATSMTVTTIRGFAARTSAQQDASVAMAGYVRIDDEVILYTDASDGGSQQFTGLTRGALGTTAAAHDNGAEVSEVLVARNIHPIGFMLQLLHSPTGNGAVLWDSLTSLHDNLTRFTTDNDVTLTEGRGAGLQVGQIDATQISVGVAGTYFTGGYEGSFYIDEDIDDIKQWCEEHILKPLRAFFYVSSAGKLCIGVWDDRAGSGVIEQNDMVRPSMSIEYDKIRNNAKIQYDLEPVEGTYLTTDIFEDADSGAAQGRGEPFTVESPWIRSDDFGGGALTPTVITQALWDALLERFGAPIQVLEAEHSLSYLTTEIDDVIGIQHEHLPDLSAGYRGLQGADFHVVGKTIDLRRGVVRLKLIRMP